MSVQTVWVELTGASGVWRLGHRPALDGLRGVAIALVTVSHFATAGTPLKWVGILGVPMFFVLSGFLITSLLMEEHHDSGRIDVRRFFGRRARRLLPALVAVVAASLLVSLVVEDFADLESAAWVLTYFSNWFQVAGGDLSSAFGHTWSLAVEEQFYLTWPFLLLLLFRLSPRRQGQLLAFAVGLSALVPVAIGPDPWVEVYSRTDARAVSLLAGALLALAMHARPGRARGRTVVTLLALGAIVATGFVSMAFTLILAPLVTTAATVAMIRECAATSGVGWLSWGPLRWLGHRSYGLYLWQTPVFLLLGREDLAWWEVGLHVALVLVIAEVSWRVIERPFLRRSAQATRVWTRKPAVPPEPGTAAEAEAGRAPAATPVAL